MDYRVQVSTKKDSFWDKGSGTDANVYCRLTDIKGGFENTALTANSFIFGSQNRETN